MSGPTDTAAAAAGPPPIAVLPDHVIDQIAAGEVIERPASVIKELVDNAIDAGAQHITVDVDGGGRTRMRVVDDGHGMRASDVRAALSRHATSKLRHVDDLMRLTTHGFRGEALPSIAAVSRLTLITRCVDAPVATRVEVVAGTITEITEVGAPIGTSIEVRDLLFNVPARLKFLKSDATEASQITEWLTRVAFAYPELALRLRHGGRAALEALPAVSALARAQALVSPRAADSMVEIQAEEGGVRVRALLAAPEFAGGTSRALQLMVGRRPVRDRGLLHAVQMGYGELVPRGRTPLAVITVDVPDGLVDINVHPQKLEVRFADAALVATAVRHSVRRGVTRAPWGDAAAAVSLAATTSWAAPARTSAPLAHAVGQAHGLVPPQSALPFAGQRAADRAPSAASPSSWAESLRAALHVRAVGDQAAASAQPSLPAWAPAPVPSPSLSSVAAGPAPASGDAPAVAPIATAGYFAALRYLGQLDRTFLICEGDGELVLLDQHVAHELVAFARLQRARIGRESLAQPLLFPERLTLSPAQLSLARTHADALAEVGFALDWDGPEARLRTVPAGVDAAVAVRLLTSRLPSRAEAVAALADTLLADIACHSVVRAGDVLAPEAVRALLADLDGVGPSRETPHGRPMLLRLGVDEIARRFGR